MQKIDGFDDMSAAMLSHKKLQQLIVRCMKLNKSLVFITQSYLTVPIKW